MPVQNYGARNGMSTLLFLVHKLCTLFGKYTLPIIAFIDASDLTEGEKTTVKNWLTAATAVCVLLETLKVTYE